MPIQLKKPKLVEIIDDYDSGEDLQMKINLKKLNFMEKILKMDFASIYFTNFDKNMEIFE